MGLLAYLVAFQAGVGPVPWVYNPEVEPSSVPSPQYSSDLPTLVPEHWGEYVHRLQLVAQPGCVVHLPLPATGDPHNTIALMDNLNLQGLGFGAYYFFAGMALIALTWFSLVLPESKVS